ncbi:glycosyltransferase 87 family protein [Streptacidiphilus fuscans]|uniref:DUF2029 domain-containing protein n=1 Tax=Streptacidiphilus fuscans TaxID=2789292 RepID=A0A931BEV6_9ACTN|nr:glycosyltransferase 87 family protein [Streptacidiphilus fuscans]MBF9071635.1 hypothetical protein [Streptacidiphilus fuscans]MBF9072878.1 hypothetical protein [Streptacidiphilus fuscans]
MPRPRVERFAAAFVGPEGTWLVRRTLWVLGALVCGGWALGFPLISNIPAQRYWGWSAAVGYGLAALAAALLPRARAFRVAVALALTFALVVPMAVLLARNEGQSEIWVVQQSATRLLHTGSPYILHPQDWRGYTPYLPGMALFGLPHLVLPGALGDVRIWFLLAFLGFLVATWKLLRGGSTAGLAVPLGAVLASPLVALPAAVSGVDLPMIGGCCFAMALAGRGYAARAGVVLGLVCAIKWTAWPAVPVGLLLLYQVGGWRAVRRSALWTAIVGGVLVVPFAVAFPGTMLEQVIRFPLGLSSVRTPADSPLPGHLLAELGPAGRMGSLALLGLGGLAICVWLVVRPPQNARAACDRLALGVATAFLLAPAGRFGYLQLPALLFLWPRLALHAGPDAPDAEPGPFDRTDDEDGTGVLAGVGES